MIEYTVAALDEKINQLIKVVVVLLVFVAPPVGWVYYDATRTGWVCYEWATVVEITEIGYRSGEAVMSNGVIKEFGQPKTPVRVGNEYCTHGAIERNDLPDPWYIFWS